MKITGLFCFVLLHQMSSSCYGTRRIDIETQMSGVESYLSRLNKTPVKSIESPDGDIIDCVDIYKQPALDHPLLKDHSIQMRPNYYPEELFTERNLSGNNNDIGHFETITQQLWQENGKCPEGTIPIRRTTKDDLLRADSIERFGKKSPGSIPNPRSKSASLVMDNEENHENVIGYVDSGDKYYGARADINVWQPKIELPNEFSLSQMWIVGGDFGPDTNTIEIGWQVSPQIYGDNQTRLFTYWTRDKYQSTGCYNLLCSGFVQTSKIIALGGTITPLSSYSGSQYEISILVWKDPNGNWWLQFEKDQIVGYWPASLFTHLKDNAANVIEWGGEITNMKPNGRHTTTQMGSGHFAEEGFEKASYFNKLQILDGYNTFSDVVGLRSATSVQTGCYNIKISDDGKEFFYGGPGRNEKCP